MNRIALLLILGTFFIFLRADEFKVFKFQGNVQIKKKGEEWKKLDASTVFKQGDELQTEEGAEVQIQSSTEQQENQITLKEEATLICAAEGQSEGKKPEPPVFQLQKGSAYFSIISKAENQDVRFTLKTQVGVAGVKGTRFLVSQGKQGMKVAVEDSQVEVTDQENRRMVLGANQAGYIQPWEEAEFTAVGSGVCPEPVAGTAETLQLVFPTGIPDEEMLMSARVEFMKALEHLIGRISDPKERERVQAFDRVRLFQELLSQIQKEQRPPEVILYLPLAPVIQLLGLQAQTRAVTEFRPVSASEFGMIFGGTARLKAERGAKLAGYRELAERIRGVRVESETSVRDFTTESDKIRAEVDAFIMKGANLSHYEYYSDGSVEAFVFIDPRVASKALENIIQKPLGKQMMRSEEGLSPETLGQFR
jgi:hypothetical protein